MPEKKQDPVISAVEAVHRALEPLDSETRRKVLDSIYALLDVAGPKPSGAQIQTGQQSGISRVHEVPVKPGARPMSLIEVMREKNPATSTQRIAVFAYYREKYEGIARFSRDDIEAYFARAKLAPPANYGRDFVNAVKEGWIHEDGAESYLTSRGIEAVESGFAVERVPSKPSRKRPKAAPRKKAGKR